jgi:hypothetical protein
MTASHGCRDDWGAGIGARHRMMPVALVSKSIPYPLYTHSTTTSHPLYTHSIHMLHRRRHTCTTPRRSRISQRHSLRESEHVQGYHEAEVLGVTPERRALPPHHHPVSHPPPWSQKKATSQRAFRTAEPMATPPHISPSRSPQPPPQPVSVQPQECVDVLQLGRLVVVGNVGLQGGGGRERESGVVTWVVKREPAGACA